MILSTYKRMYAVPRLLWKIKRGTKFWTRGPDRIEKQSEISVPSSRNLFETVERSTQMTHMRCPGGVNKARRLIATNDLRKIPTKEGVLAVKLVNSSTGRERWREQSLWWLVEKPCKTQWALYIARVPSGWNLCQKIHLPKTMLALGGDTRSHVWLESRAWNCTPWLSANTSP